MSEGRPHSEDQLEPEPLSGPPAWVKRVLIAGAVLLVILGATALAVYKPRGLTRYGQRKQRQIRTRTAPTPVLR